MRRTDVLNLVRKSSSRKRQAANVLEDTGKVIVAAKNPKLWSPPDQNYVEQVDDEGFYFYYYETRERERNAEPIEEKKRII